MSSERGVRGHAVARERERERERDTHTHREREREREQGIGEVRSPETQCEQRNADGTSRVPSAARCGLLLCDFFNDVQCRYTMHRLWVIWGLVAASLGLRLCRRVTALVTGGSGVHVSGVCVAPTAVECYDLQAAVFRVFSQRFGRALLGARSGGAAAASLAPRGARGLKRHGSTQQ